MNRNWPVTLSISLIVLTACGGGSTDSPTPKDTVAPTITLNGKNPLKIALDKKFDDAGATAVDNIDGDITKSIVQSNNVKMNNAACYTQEYSVTDAAGNNTKKERIILVGTDKQRHSPNTLPSPQQDSVSTAYTKSVVVKPLENDLDSDCDTLNITAITQATAGIATLNKANNTISFDSQKTVGSYYFTYTVSDGHGGEKVSGISIASHDPNDANDGWPKTKADTATMKVSTKIFIDVIANDTDPENDALIIQMVDTPKHGAVIIENNGLSYSPNIGFKGTDRFYYGVHDGHGHIDSSEVTVTVTP